MKEKEFIHNGGNMFDIQRIICKSMEIKSPFIIFLQLDDCLLVTGCDSWKYTDHNTVKIYVNEALIGELNDVNVYGIVKKEYFLKMTKQCKE